MRGDLLCALDRLGECLAGQELIKDEPYARCAVVASAWYRSHRKRRPEPVEGVRPDDVWVSRYVITQYFL